MVNPAGRCREHGRRAAWFAVNQFSSVLVRLGREVLRVRVRRSAVPAAISAVVHIPPAQPALVFRPVQEWAERRDYHPRECPPSQLDVQARLLAAQDSVISTGPKKGR
jgi:hypothetical protein